MYREAAPRDTRPLGSATELNRFLRHYITRWIEKVALLDIVMAPLSWKVWWFIKDFYLICFDYRIRLKSKRCANFLPKQTNLYFGLKTVFANLFVVTFGVNWLRLSAITVAAPNSAYLNQVFYTIRARGRAGKFPVGGRPLDLKQLLMW